MRYGKFSQTAWMRSVRPQLHKREGRTGSAPSPFEGASWISGEHFPEERFFWADAVVEGKSCETAYYGVFQAAGELASKGVLPRGVSVRILLPPHVGEDGLSETAEQIVCACERLGLEIHSFQGETVSGIAGILISVTAVGVTGKGTVQAGTGPAGKKERDILLCGYAGLEGMLRVLADAQEELSGRFAGSFLAQAKELSSQLADPRCMFSLRQGLGPMYIRQVASGGIMAALWEMGEELESGLEIDKYAISFRQETIEICEFYRLNPYHLTSAGSFLIVTDKGEAVMDFLKQKGQKVSRLGYVKSGKARLIRTGEETGYLDRPAADELAVWMAGRREEDGKKDHQGGESDE